MNSMHDSLQTAEIRSKSRITAAFFRKTPVSAATLLQITGHFPLLSFIFHYAPLS